MTLIDPFQLIDWKDQTPPDHLYPKFKIFLDNFKSGCQTQLPAISYLNTKDEKTNTSESTQEGLPETCTPEPTQLDALLQNINRPDSQLL